MNIKDFFEIKKRTNDMLKSIDENLEKMIAASNEMKDKVLDYFYKSIKNADRERIFTFKIKDFAMEYKKLTGVKIFAKLQSTGGYVCEGHVATKEELLKKYGNKELTYFIKLNDGEVGCGASRECDLNIKMTDVLPNGKRLIDSTTIEHWTSGSSSSCIEKRTYLKNIELSQAEIEQLVISVSPLGFMKDEKSKSQDEEAFETAVVNASQKHYERTHGQGKE